MKMNFGISLNRGIYFSLALLACCVPVTHAVAVQADAKSAEAEQTAPEEDAKPDVADTESEQDESDETPKSVEDQVLELTAQFKSEYSEFVAAFNAAKTRTEKSRLLRSNPRQGYAKKFLELYEANVGDKDALPALQQALAASSRRSAAKPTKMLVDLLETLDDDDAQSSCAVLIKYADTRSKKMAAEKLLELSKKATDKLVSIRKNAIQSLLPVANTPIRGVTDLQKEALESIWELANVDLESTDIVALAAVGFNADDDSSAGAFNAIMEHHLDDENIAMVLARLPQTLNPGYEAIIQEVAKNGEGDLQAQAAISLAKYIPVRDEKLDQSQLDDSKLAMLKKEKADLKKVLGNFDGDSDLHKKAQEELFVLENLSPGAEAMDIVGTDLDGKELKLSDYRGRVVFLDFWGDW